MLLPYFRAAFYCLLLYVVLVSFYDLILDLQSYERETSSFRRYAPAAATRLLRCIEVLRRSHHVDLTWLLLNDVLLNYPMKNFKHNRQNYYFGDFVAFLESERLNAVVHDCFRTSRVRRYKEK
uniref:Uncharacterized protein n=1 Tax=Glossina pallidipes TaxID=7398 RepID=A0A1A9Z7N0_GLOPL